MEGHRGHRERKQLNSGGFIQPSVCAARAVSKGNGSWLLLHDSCMLGVTLLVSSSPLLPWVQKGAGQIALLPTLQLFFPSFYNTI